ncbi:MAG: hypothetical protein GC192_02830 [Bacteroidetes bacterium]|nr:hypothetical protein [Bacteroidota bacterium]
MKKLVFTFILCFFYCFHVYSQKVYVISKIGISRSNIFYKSSPKKLIGEYKTKLHFGGAMAFEPRNGIRFCLGLERWNRGYTKLLTYQYLGPGSPKYYYKLHTIYDQVPIYTEFLFGKHAKILMQLGIEINHLVRQKVEFPDDLVLIDFYEEPTFRNFEQSILFGFGAEIPLDERISLKVNTTSRIGMSGLRPNQKLYSNKQAHNISYGIEIGLGYCILQ